MFKYFKGSSDTFPMWGMYFIVNYIINNIQYIN